MRHVAVQGTEDGHRGLADRRGGRKVGCSGLGNWPEDSRC